MARPAAPSPFSLSVVWKLLLLLFLFLLLLRLRLLSLCEDAGVDSGQNSFSHQDGSRQFG